MFITPIPTVFLRIGLFERLGQLFCEDGDVHGANDLLLS